MERAGGRRGGPEENGMKERMKDVEGRRRRHGDVKKKRKKTNELKGGAVKEATRIEEKEQ